MSRIDRVWRWQHLAAIAVALLASTTARSSALQYGGDDDDAFSQAEEILQVSAMFVELGSRQRVQLEVGGGGHAYFLFCPLVACTLTQTFAGCDYEEGFSWRSRWGRRHQWLCVELRGKCATRESEWMSACMMWW